MIKLYLRDVSNRLLKLPVHGKRDNIRMDIKKEGVETIFKWSVTE